ncbi:MAG: hypothetical protein JXR96_26170 [Deltaproteobacteria bacterium]|nr:hypothetical protein [Deltaproteobacteria bacterium]
MRRYAYRVCQVQFATVTFADGRWQGDVPVESIQDLSRMGDHCPKVWDYLAAAGEEGWELAAAVSETSPHGQVERLYLKRPLDG